MSNLLRKVTFAVIVTVGISLGFLGILTMLTLPGLY